jgi:hypothetical protein
MTAFIYYIIPLTTGKIMKTKVLLLSIILVIFTLGTGACSGNAAGVGEAIQDAKDPQATAAFQSDMKKLVKEVQKDPKYNKIPLNNKSDQDWFTTQAFLLWDHKMSKQAFINTGLEKFPSHEYEFNFIADRLSR